MNPIAYEQDFAAWAFNQAALMKAGQLNHLDLNNLIEEMESMGRSEHRELGNRMILLIGHLLKWHYQPARQGNSWRRTIAVQRKNVLKLLQDSPSLKAHFDDVEWFQDIWTEAVDFAERETQLHDIFPEEPIWPLSDILTDHWLPQ